MRIDLARHAMAAAAGLGLLLTSACKERTKTADTGHVEAPAATDTAAMAAAPVDTGNAMTNHSPMTDANIVALLDEANKADSAAGAYAVGKAVSADVKAFARMMMSEHHALRVQGRDLAKKLKVTPEPPNNDPVQAAGESETSALKAAGKGAAFDSVYIDQEVTIHKAVLDLAEKAHGDTSNEDLKKLIETAKPVIQKHLDRAEEIQKSLHKTTT